MRVPYRGETSGKNVARRFIWWAHELLLGAASFRRKTPHVFLASRIAGDVGTLLMMGVLPDHVWAVDIDKAQCEYLWGLRDTKGVRVINRNVASVVEKHALSDNIRSVFLDYCGNIHGTKKTTQRVVAKLLPGSVVSITLMRGRETDGTTDREGALKAMLQEASPYRVTLVQTVSYMSEDGTSKGSAMETWTFYIGPLKSRSKTRFDLTKEDLVGLAASEKATRDLWEARHKQSAKRSQAAVQANITRSL